MCEKFQGEKSPKKAIVNQVTTFRRIRNYFNISSFKGLVRHRIQRRRALYAVQQQFVEISQG